MCAGCDPVSEKLKVKIHASRGRLRLIWSSRGKRYFFALKLDDTPLNRTYAQQKALAIHMDLVSGNFDKSLDKYREEGDRRDQKAITDILQEFTNYKASRSDPRTLEKYVALKNYLSQHFGNTRIYQLNNDTAEKFTNWMLDQIEPITFKGYLAILRSCWDWGNKRELINTGNPWKDIKLKVPPKQKVKPMNSEEVAAVLKGFEELFPEYLNYVKFLFGCGCRTGEANALQWKHFSEDCTEVWFGESLNRFGRRKEAKNNKARTVRLSKKIVAMLHEHRWDSWEPEDLVFTSLKGGRIDDHNFRNRQWVVVLKHVEVPYRKPYVTRATFISMAAEMMSPADIAEITGHDVATLYEHYLGSVAKNLRVPDLI